MRDIVINCKKVYETGTLYKNKVEEVDDIEKKLNTILENLKSVWSGDDSHNFCESFSAHIYELENIKNFLSGNADILKENALEHNESNDRYSSQLERSDQNEYIN